MTDNIIKFGKPKKEDVEVASSPTPPQLDLNTYRFNLVSGSAIESTGMLVSSEHWIGVAAPDGTLLCIIPLPQLDYVVRVETVDTQ